MADKVQNEVHIISQLVHGDQEAFTSLYHSYVEHVFYFALRYLKTREDAENITQEVFVKIWETRQRIKPEGSFSAYLFTIAKNLIFNINRKKVNEAAYLDHLTRVVSHMDSGTEKALFYRELQEQVDRCVEQLPGQRKRVFVLSRQEGLSHKEISLKLGISEKTVAAHIRLGLQALRKVLKEEK